MHTQISLGDFLSKFPQKGYSRSKTEKVNITIELCIFEFSLGTKFYLKLNTAIELINFWTKCAQKGYFQS